MVCKNIMSNAQKTLIAYLGITIGPMTNFEDMKLFEFLMFAHIPNKHWTNSSGWKIAMAMHNVLLNQTKLVVQNINFASINWDEITTMDNKS
jgi:hypothetical protein